MVTLTDSFFFLLISGLSCVTVQALWTRSAEWNPKDPLVMGTWKSQNRFLRRFFIFVSILSSLWFSKKYESNFVDTILLISLGFTFIGLLFLPLQILEKTSEQSAEQQKDSTTPLRELRDQIWLGLKLASLPTIPFFLSVMSMRWFPNGGIYCIYASLMICPYLFWKTFHHGVHQLLSKRAKVHSLEPHQKYHLWIVSHLGSTVLSQKQGKYLHIYFDETLHESMSPQERFFAIQHELAHESLAHSLKKIALILVFTVYIIVSSLIIFYFSGNLGLIFLAPMMLLSWVAMKRFNLDCELAADSKAIQTIFTIQPHEKKDDILVSALSCLKKAQAHPLRIFLIEDRLEKIVKTSEREKFKDAA